MCPCLSVLVIPRPTAEDDFRSSVPVDIDLEILKSKFDMRLSDAARTLGISITSLKQVCRKLGVARWPRRLPCTTGTGSKDSKPPNHSDNHSSSSPDVPEKSRGSSSGVELATATRKRSADMLTSATSSYLATLGLPLPARQSVVNTNMPRHRVQRLAPQNTQVATRLGTHWSSQDTGSGAHTLVSHNFKTLPAAQRPFQALPWTSSVSSANSMSVVSPKVAVQQQTNDVALQQVPFIQLGQHSPALTSNDTVYAKILATRRELASLKALQTLQNDTAYPSLHSLLQH